MYIQEFSPREIRDIQAIPVDADRGFGAAAWANYAACRTVTDGSFVELDVNNSQKDTDERSAERQKLVEQYCGQCVVAEQCLVNALARQEKWGIWGGNTTEERDAMLKDHKKRITRARQARRARTLAEQTLAPVQ